jgi:hypothetical protein
LPPRTRTYTLVFSAFVCNISPYLGHCIHSFILIICDLRIYTFSDTTLHALTSDTTI